MLDDVGPGHNSAEPTKTDPVGADRLRSFIERVERLETERAEINDGIKDIYTEAKSAGYDVKIVKQVVRIRKADPQKQAESEELLRLYRAAVGS